MNRRASRPGSPNRGQPSVQPLGKIRRSQVITTYAVGSVVDLESGSFMPLGQEDWEMQTQGARQTSITIYEPRLQAQLGVDHFRAPPILEEVDDPTRYGQVDPRYAVPAARFPQWHECPKCHRLGTEDDPFAIDDKGTGLICIGCNRRRVNPVRFVVACVRGHIQDFPWVWWAHRKAAAGVCAQPQLFLKSRNKSAALGDLYVFCRGCDEASSMGDAFSKRVFEGLTCRGARPWLMDHEDCTEHPRTLQRGASNLHFPSTASALSIPPASEAVFVALDEHWSVYRALPASAREGILSGVAQELGVPLAVVVAAFEQRLALEQAGPGYTQAASRYEEYLALCTDKGHEIAGEHVSHFENRTSAPPDSLAPWFDLVGGVARLREVRALAGFTRIEPYPASGDRIMEAITAGRISPISKTPRNWLPGAEIRGEGIFLRFRKDALDRWASGNPHAGERAGDIDRRAKAFAADRGYQPEHEVSPQLLLIHSFAHALIRQLSIDCGYSSSALRERLYVSNPSDPSAPAMSGVLIYTGSPDSEGSLGGLVRLSQPDLLEGIVLRALRNSAWCGSDPVCIETTPDLSGERLSGAACHCCLLLPETACEKFNRELDRSMLVGGPDGNYQGFFSGSQTRN